MEILEFSDVLSSVMIEEIKRAIFCRQIAFGKFINEPTLKSKACLKCLYFTKIISDLCCYLE